MISTIKFIYKDNGIYIIKSIEAFVLDNRRRELKVGESIFCLKNVKSVTMTNKTGSLDIYKS